MFSQKEFTSIFLVVKELSTKRFDQNGILTHSFSGEVKTESAPPNEIIFDEFVRWNNEDSLLINSKNIYRWTNLASGNIKLEHLRFGRDNPVMLVELTQVSESQLESIEPHNCNRDLYSANLKIENGKLVLNWTVKGPTENYSLETIYF